MWEWMNVQYQFQQPDERPEEIPWQRTLSHIFLKKYAAQGGPECFVIVNIQVLGSTTYSLGLYHMRSTPVQDIPLLESFIRGDDAYRNSRFKLIPYISKDDEHANEDDAQY